MNEEYFPLSDLLALVAVLWFPVFALAAAVQWRIVRHRDRAAVLLAVTVVAEIVLAFGVWLSPLALHFPNIELLESLSIGSIPFVAGLMAALLATGALAVVCRKSRASH